MIFTGLLQKNIENFINNCYIAKRQRRRRDGVEADPSEAEAGTSSICHTTIRTRVQSCQLCVKS